MSDYQRSKMPKVKVPSSSLQTFLAAPKTKTIGWGIAGCLILLISISVLSYLSASQILVESSQVRSRNLPNASQKYLNTVVEAQSVVTPKHRIISKNLVSPQFSAGGVIAIDIDTDQILYEKNIHQRLSPASTTKIMTALTAVDSYNLGEVLEVKPEALVSGSSMNLSSGEHITVRSLLYGMMLNSGNDAAYALATSYPAGYSSFVSKMNEKALLLGLKDTNFENPAGFDSLNHYSSAYDMSVIARLLIRNPQVSKIVSTTDTQVTSVDNTHVHNLRNLNKLLGQDGVIGIKTGFTEKAGENLVGLVDRNGHKVLTVVLASNDRFGETKSLMDWVYANYEWQN